MTTKRTTNTGKLKKNQNLHENSVPANLTLRCSLKTKNFYDWQMAN